MRWFAQQIFKILGWKIVGEVPPHPKAILVIAPHTSNWDFFYGMTTIFIKKAKAKFAIKKEIMFFPLGTILKWLGAIPIDRGAPTSIINGKRISQVSKMVELLNQQEKMFLIIAPEGTRKYAKRWKTGFYHIAVKAGVPIILGYLDYSKKEAGIGPTVYPTGNIDADIATIKDFYKTKSGKYPDQGVLDETN